MKSMALILIASVTLLSVVLISCCVSSLPSSEKGILAGNVTVGPLSPVERVDVTPTAPPPEVFTSRSLIVYEADSVTKVADVPIEAAGFHGIYSVSLSPGTYVLDVPRQGIGHASPLPKRVTIEAGKTTTVDVDIDTGIR